MKRANRSDIYNEFKIEVANSSETLVKRTEIHVFIFLKTVLFRAD